MFRVGDRVIAVYDIDGIIYKNDVGTVIIEDNSDESIGVEWDKKSLHKHNLNNKCKKNRGWWVHSENIKLLNTNDKTITIPEVLAIISSLDIPEDIYKIINDKFMEMV